MFAGRPEHNLFKREKSMSYQVQLAVIYEEPDQSLVSLTLHNVSEFTLSRWCLQFIFERNINLDSITHGKVVK